MQVNWNCEMTVKHSNWNSEDRFRVPGYGTFTLTVFTDSGSTVNLYNFMALSCSNGTSARICLGVTIVLLTYYFLWVSIVPFLLLDEGITKVPQNRIHIISD